MRPPTCQGYSREYFFFFNDTSTTEIYTLSLHDALPISTRLVRASSAARSAPDRRWTGRRSEEHTSELQSRGHLVCRLLLAKKKTYWNVIMPQLQIIQRNYKVSSDYAN